LKNADLPAAWEDAARSLPLPDVFQGPLPTSRELFSLQGEMLPCYLPQDEDPNDNWLLAPNYYPYYFALFRHLAARKAAQGQGPLRLLEIGVRTGNMAAIFARATEATGGEYLGIDPNLYMAEGLKLAVATARRLQEAYPGFRHQFIQGYSSADIFQQNLELLGPFDLIHIDGDHSTAGKVIDVELARRIVAPGGLVLLDDFNHAPRKAVRGHRPAPGLVPARGHHPHPTGAGRADGGVGIAWALLAEYVPNYGIAICVEKIVLLSCNYVLWLPIRARIPETAL
jgi:predicted O-methyltransferase YrrM